jgi:cadmium resistance protein CadD (predicted permease)
MIAKMRTVASSNPGTIVVAGATLANAGAFIPVALKNISQLDPTAAEYVADWTAFTIVSLLPLAVAILLLLVARRSTERRLDGVRRWLERHAHTVGAVLVLALGVALMRNGIAGLVS